MEIKKLAYTTIYSLLGTEALAIGMKFYRVYKANTMITFAGGFAVMPYWLLLEGCMVGLAPILTKHIIKALRSESTSDNSELAELIKSLHRSK